MVYNGKNTISERILYKFQEKDLIYNLGGSDMIRDIIDNHNGTFTVIGYDDSESKTFEATSAFEAADMYRDYCFGANR